MALMLQLLGSSHMEPMYDYITAPEKESLKKEPRLTQSSVGRYNIAVRRRLAYHFLVG